MKRENFAQISITLLVAVALVLLWWGGGSRSPLAGERPAAESADPTPGALGPIAATELAPAVIAPAVEAPRDDAPALAEDLMRVQVIDDVGTPVGGSVVQLMHLHDRELVPASAAVRTAEDGVALVRVVAADAVVARGEGYATAVARSPQAGQTCLLRMLRGAHVRMRLLDQSGNPVAGVDVRAWQRGLASAGDVSAGEGRIRRPSPMVVDVRDVVASAVSNEDGVADLGTLLGGNWSWGPTDPSVAVLETTGDGNESLQLLPGVDLTFDATIGTVRAAVVRVVGDGVISATWFARSGPRVARHPRAVQLVRLGLSRRYPDALVAAAVPIAVPEGVDLEHRSMDLTLVLADRGTITREIPLLPVADLRPIELSVAELPVVRASPRVEVRMVDARGVRIDGLGLDFRGRDGGQDLEVETGRVQPIPVGRYTVASMRHHALGKPLKMLGELSVDEGATELQLKLPIDVFVRRLKVIGADGRVPRSLVVTLMQGDRSLGQRFFTEPREVTVVATDSSAFARVEAFGYQDAEVHGLSGRPELIEVVLDRTP